MKLEQDEKTGKWRNSASSEFTFATRGQAKSAWIEKKLASIKSAMNKVLSARHK